MLVSLLHKDCLRPASLLKERVLRLCFLVNFAKVLRTLFTERLRVTASDANIVANPYH